MAKSDGEPRSKVSARLESLQAEMLAAGDFDRTACQPSELEGLEILPPLYETVEGIRTDLAERSEGLEILPQLYETVEAIRAELAERLEGLEMLTQLYESVEGLRQEVADNLDARNDLNLQELSEKVDNVSSAIYSLDSELQNLASTIEGQGEASRMSIRSAVNNLGSLLRLLVLAAVFMVIRFWPSEWAVHF